MTSLPETDASPQVKLWLGAKNYWLQGNVPRDAEVLRQEKKKKVEGLFHGLQIDFFNDIFINSSCC